MLVDGLPSLCPKLSLLHTSYYVKYNERLISECTVSVTEKN